MYGLKYDTHIASINRENYKRLKSLAGGNL